MKRMIFSVLAVISALVFSNCSSTLQNAERENSLYGAETARGEARQTGSYDDREENLAKQEINDRDVTVDPKRGYPGLVDNESNDPVTITVKKASFWGNNPITAQFDFYGNGAREGYLMPGSYEVSCYLGGILQWKKIYEVTTAPKWDDKQKKYYYWIIRNVFVTYGQMNHGQYRYHYHHRY
jgi:hypothetical protein